MKSETTVMTCASGLVCTTEVIDTQTERELLAWIDDEKREWTPAPGGRVVLQFGYSYLYETKTVGVAPPIPDLLDRLMDSLVERKLLGRKPNQILINKYEPGQGISAHTDAKCFGDEISSLSLQSATTMLFGGSFTHRLLPRSLVVMSGNARWRITHAIPARKRDPEGPRGRRISLTFRFVPPASS